MRSVFVKTLFWHPDCLQEKHFTLLHTICDLKPNIPQNIIQLGKTSIAILDQFLTQRLDQFLTQSPQFVLFNWTNFWLYSKNW